jgi:hypothetical protein
VNGIETDEEEDEEIQKNTQKVLPLAKMKLLFYYIEKLP